MNVYTHYRTITPSIGFRWRTLLQFGKLAEHPVYGQSAQRFFEAALSLGMAGGDIPMEQHPFYHPLYLMRHAQNKPVCVEEREQFFAAPWGGLAGEKYGQT